MALENPRRHVWEGDDGLPLTFIIRIENPHGDDARHLVKHQNVIAAISLALGQSIPIPDHIEELHIHCRPLREIELKKVSIQFGEVLDLDEASYVHLIGDDVTTSFTPDTEADDGQG